MTDLKETLNGGSTWKQPREPQTHPESPAKEPMEEPESDDEEPVLPAFTQPPVHLRRVSMNAEDYAKELEEHKEKQRKSKEEKQKMQSESSGAGSSWPGGHMFPDAEEMKQKVREALLEPSYNVFDFYYETGCFQAIAKSTAFENVTLFVIALNAIWIAIDTDNNDASTLLEAELHFQIADNAFCGYFFLEWVIRFGAFENKCNCRKDAWFVFDSLLVAMMVAETWVMTAVLIFTSADNAVEATGGNSLRLFRLLRLSRMARMLRSMPELMILIKGMAAATRSVFSVMCLLIIIMYVFAIAFKQLAEGTSMGAYYFPSVQHSMYTLLIYGTFLDDLAPFCDEVGAESAACLLLVMIFVLLAACTVLNMLIGVLCEVVTAVAETEKEEVLVSFVTTKLQTLLQTLDQDNDGHISQGEFMKILEIPEAAGALEEVGVDPVNIIDYMDFIFQQRHGALPFNKFMEIILNLRQTNQCTIGDIVDLRKFVHHQCGCAESLLFANLAGRRAVTGSQPSRAGSSRSSPANTKDIPAERPTSGSHPLSPVGQGRNFAELQARTSRLEDMMTETLLEVRRIAQRVPEEGGYRGSNSPSKSENLTCPNCSAKMLPRAQVLRSSSSPNRRRHQNQDRHHVSPSRRGVEELT
mmetsp:Transcript_58512/g.104035  ORF Transcript_58512/g.104035 Transcript_58512/m.104035 type:complete len:640 (+) Transcript_58512:100-2019(+)|eukprot:CAMPEP_0197632718 /NCGR_PEP_ID=MMETSP1338-20131121/9328_1 /TAXON_ID=43686 ORGANISM="Pelagodinium beii, Strain RCC1491" /NCGR_SAMPLE_ID=MMETSP1338 /ASSEMBLY_ACC=CAM_ASM_000754 /LENGTH=639 /DNA_ID=CAMNT_0043204285 /DNA_START=78 /DNA_END=1997 /DNA_ORIENTATION=+